MYHFPYIILEKLKYFKTLKVSENLTLCWINFHLGHVRIVSGERKLNEKISRQRKARSCTVHHTQLACRRSSRICSTYGVGSSNWGDSIRGWISHAHYKIDHSICWKYKTFVCSILYVYYKPATEENNANLQHTYNSNNIIAGWYQPRNNSPLLFGILTTMTYLTTAPIRSTAHPVRPAHRIVSTAGGRVITVVGKIGVLNCVCGTLKRSPADGNVQSWNEK